MALRLEAVTFDVADAPAVAAFWAALLDREVLAEPGGAFLPGDNTQVGLRFVPSDTKQVGRPRLHLHLTSSSLEQQQRTVETALRLGGRHLDVGQGPDDEFVVLADPGGNELCVIEPGNNYLAGPATSARSPVTEPATSACSGATRWTGRWCGTRTNRPQSSRPSAAPRSHGTHGANGRPNPRTKGTVSASTSSPPTRLSRRNDWSRSVRPDSPTGPTASNWPTQTATNSAFTQTEGNSAVRGLVPA
jgi:hypothetical protein